MKISTKGRYALRMMVDLAEHQNGEYISLKDIAQRQEVSKKYLEQIVPILNKSGFLNAVTSALGKLLAITENYPDLKANQNFLELQAQLEGTENRINVARTNFNNAAQAYNTAIRRFPKSLFASMFGFDKHAYFEAAEGTETAPTVSF